MQKSNKKKKDGGRCVEFFYALYERTADIF
jgi:hypothetical protein